MGFSCIKGEKAIKEKLSVPLSSVGRSVLSVQPSVHRGTLCAVLSFSVSLAHSLPGLIKVGSVLGCIA